MDEKQYYSSIILTPADFNEATKLIQPSAKREGFATVPDVTWDDVGALSDIREELTMSILAPVKLVMVTSGVGKGSGTEMQTQGWWVGGNLLQSSK